MRGTVNTFFKQIRGSNPLDTFHYMYTNTFDYNYNLSFYKLLA